MRKRILFTGAMAFFLAGCNLQGIVPDQIPGLSGALPANVRADHVNMVAKSVKATANASRPISDTEEYYIGRAVAARILSSYPLLADRKLTEYVNMVGQTVALNSDRPVTYSGYHFALLDSDELNAFACPGGTILITRGMIRAVNSEDELAAVLAHEVAHINHRDGISAISKSRWTEALTIIGAEAAKTYGPQSTARLVGIFEGSIDDVFKTLVVNGYGRGQEYDADRSSMRYLARAGYDPGAMGTFLAVLKETGKGSSGGVLKTHPGTEERLENVRSNMPERQADPAQVRIRTDRFDRLAGS